MYITVFAEFAQLLREVAQMRRDNERDMGEVKNFLAQLVESNTQLVRLATTTNNRARRQSAPSGQSTPSSKLGRFPKKVCF